MTCKMDDCSEDDILAGLCWGHLIAAGYHATEGQRIGGALQAHAIVMVYLREKNKRPKFRLVMNRDAHQQAR